MRSGRDALARSVLSGITQRHRLGPHLKIDLGVDVGDIEADMAEPRADRVEVDTGLQEVAGARVAHDMWSDRPVGQRTEEFDEVPTDVWFNGGIRNCPMVAVESILLPEWNGEMP